MDSLVLITRRFFMAIIAATILTSAAWLAPPATAHALPTNGTLFHSNMDGNNDIYVVSNDGTTLTKLTKQDTQEEAPAWSPDGNYIVYVSYVTNRTRPQLYALEVATGTTYQLTNNPDISHLQPVFSPDGATIAFITKDLDNQHCLRLYEIKTRQQTILQCGVGRVTYETPAWSPSGQELMFTVIDGEFNRFVMNLSDGSVRLLIPGAYTGIWSPDGQHIAYSMVRNKPAETEQVFIMRADGSEVRQITNDPGRSRRVVAWYPAGDRLLIMGFGAPDYRPNLSTIRIDGTQEISLTSNPNAADFSGPGAIR